jgi:hypothetical protein
MKVRDESEWQGQCAQWAAYPDALKFQKFVTTWAETAESLLDELLNSFDDTPLLTPIEALRRSLPLTEEKAGAWGASSIGQALLLLGSHWGVVDSPEAFVAGLNPIERNLYASTALAWKHFQESQAAKATS